MNPWIKAFRLRTLPLALSGWLVGISIASNYTQVNWPVAVLTLLTAFLLQILSNLANDYGDASSGVDSQRTGEERMVHTGQITSNAMRNAIVVFSALSFISGSLLLYISFPGEWMNALIFMIIGIIGIAAAIKYTVGKNPYGYAGFGDLFVFIFFGIVLVFGSYFLQTQYFDWQVLLPAASIGLFSVGVLNVNNIRDIETDKAAGKHSIPVRIGRERAVNYHRILLMLGMLLSIAYVNINYSSWHELLFVIVGILLLANIKAVANKPSSELDPHLKQMALSTLLFALLFSLGQW
ncbi:1,4-dihydroxy-2-naphthoate prenyltransferase [Ekhidna lutea]|uniref:1,4-dihydroxy-2-naphthoate octaprenyltransferase n=1 Tax=Ekhidna lutea TaxID=447679 RepID=A0A239HWP4_EKHLU|nr:1,4-dihydroxy-2-naphthoate octaprenyltransferase [Ekhidna lutea]SNS85498.1 1,4-dihydroxy-2-naphthoate prenyltransferase [Ekhidna lutea]